MSFNDQPAHILRMLARPGMGDRLFELATASLKRAGASDRYIILREDENPDVMWNIEVYRSSEAKDNFENSPLAEEIRGEMFGLLAGPPLTHVDAHVYSALPELPGDAK